MTDRAVAHAVNIDHSDGEVFDLGYRHYEGPSGGRVTALIAVYMDSVRSVLGLGRGVSAKLMPGIFALLAIGPALAFVFIAGVITSFGGNAEDIDPPGHEDYFGLSFIVMLLFAAVVGPGLLCSDRRNSVLVLYAVRPLTSLDYSIARWLAFFTFTAGFTLVPQALLYISFILSDDSPWAYIEDNGRDLTAIIVVGLILSAFMTSLAMAAASLTTRRAFASAGVIAFIFISSAIGVFGGEIMTSEQDREEYWTSGNSVDEPWVEAPDGDAGHYLNLLVLPNTFQGGVVSRTFGSRDHYPISPWYNAGVIAAVITGAVGVMVFRYRNLVT